MISTKAVEFQKKYGGPGQTVSNALQTNAILLDDDWCDFLRDNKFLVGISIDGPNADHPDELFDFLVALGTRYLQFIPCVEQDPATGQIADFSVTPHQYGEFTCRIFDRWYEYGPKKLSIRDFDSILSFCLTGRNTICTFDRQCSQYVVVEYTGDCFPCDFFVEPEWRLGNIFETPIEKLAASDKKRNFARAKKNLCNKCLLCSHLALCRGGCMKDKNALDQDWTKETYFCEGYKRFFDYTMPRFMQIAAQISSDSNTPERPFV
ncbi:MAG: SPASM domain-containing protein [Planctomycetota bacterium]